MNRHVDERRRRRWGRKNTDSRGRQRGETVDRTKSCQIKFTDLFRGMFPPPLTPDTTLTSTYLRGGQTDSAHALHTRVQAGILGLVQSRVHGEMLLAVHGHHSSRSHAPRRTCVAPGMHVGERTDLTGLLCSLRQQTELPAPPPPLLSAFLLLLLLFSCPCAQLSGCKIMVLCAQAWAKAKPVPDLFTGVVLFQIITIY